MDADIAAQPALSSLTSTSLWAYFKLFRTVIAKALVLHEEQFDNFIAEVYTIAARAVPGTAQWWKERVLEFQYGYIVEILPDFTVGYSTIDPTAQIVSQAAVVQLNGSVAIKCTTSGAPLSSAQQTGLQSYCNRIKPAGTDIVIISDNPDILNVLGNFYYDPEIDPAVVKASVDAVVAAFLGNLPFNGFFYISQFYKALTGATGYMDIKLTTIKAKPYGGTYGAVNRTYNPLSGLMNVSAALSTTLTFVPNS